MKVLFVSSGNLNNGQPSILIKNQGESLNAQGVQVYYYTIKKKGIIGYLRSVWKIAKQIRNIQPDYIHSHYSLSAFSTSIAILFFNIKIPHTVSLMGSDTKMNGWKRSLTIYLSKHQWNHTIVKATRMAKELGLKKVYGAGLDVNLHEGLKRMFNFEQEGIKRNHFFKNGEFHDLISIAVFADTVKYPDF